MFLLIVLIWLKSGGVEPRVSVVYDTYIDTRGTCEAALPLTEKLYREGKFDDGPPKELVAKVTGRCEQVDLQEDLAKG